MIVMKFGGTSVGSAERYRQVAQLVGSYLEVKPVAVVSAMSGTTDWLLNTARSLADNGRSTNVSSPTAERLMAEFHARNMEVIAKAIQQPEIRAEVTSAVASQLHQLLRLLTGIELLGDISPRSLDAVSAYGEKISSNILAGTLQDLGFK